MDSSKVINAKIAAVDGSFKAVSAMPAHVRSGILLKISGEIEKESEAFAGLICEEVFKPIRDARKEVARAAFTFRWAGEEAKRLSGELFPLDFDAAGVGRTAFIKRVPLGPCGFITPFNFPLNLAAHKVAPAMAIGASFVLKPASRAVKTAQKLRAIALKSGWPAEAFQLAVCRGAEAMEIVKDPRLKVISFTGSSEVGWEIHARAGKKRVKLELGGNAAVAVGADADLSWAARRCAWGGFCYSGQVCISLQRIYVHKKVYGKLKKMLIEETGRLKVGAPSSEETDVGPLISEADALRVEAWIREARAAGARVLAGGTRKGRTIAPTVLENVPAHCKLYAEEAFGPVVILDSFADWAEAFKKINDSKFGLQSGIFTSNLKAAVEAWDKVQSGGVVINDVPTFRSDPMPYGGCKESGVGREGIRYAMEELTEIRTLLVRP